MRPVPQIAADLPNLADEAIGEMQNQGPRARIHRHVIPFISLTPGQGAANRQQPGVH